MQNSNNNSGSNNNNIDPSKIIRCKWVGIQKKNVTEYKHLCGYTTNQNLQMPVHGWKLSSFDTLYCAACDSTFRYSTDNHSVRRHIKDCKKQNGDKYAKRKQTGTDDIRKFVKRSRTFLKDASAADQKNFDNALTAWIVATNQSFRVVEEESFKTLISIANETIGKLKVPDRNKIKDLVMEFKTVRQESVRKKIQTLMQSCCFTSDIWTSLAHEGYINLNIHFIDKNFNKHTYLLDVSAFKGKHSHDRILSYWTKILEDWGIPITKVKRMVTDAGANIKKACSVGEIPWGHCANHSLHLIAQQLCFKKKELNQDENTFTNIADAEDEFIDSMSYDDAAITTAVQKSVDFFRKLAKLFNQSQKAADRFKKIQTGIYDQAHRPLLLPNDCQTRWNSTYLLLQRCIRLKDAINAFFEYLNSEGGKEEFPTGVSVKPIGYELWTLAKLLVQLLKPFFLATNALGGEKYCTIAIAFPWLRKIRFELQRPDSVYQSVIDNDTNLARQSKTKLKKMLKNIRNYLFNAFGERFSQVNDGDGQMCILSPSIAYAILVQKKLVGIDELKTEIEPWLMDRMLHAISKYDLSYTTINMVSTTGNNVDLEFDTGVFPSAEDAAPSATNSGSTTTTTTTTTDLTNYDPIKDECRRQITKYYSLIKMEGTSKVTKVFWNKNKDDLNILANVAQDHLGIPATSTDSERLYSAMSNIIHKKRASLNPETASAIAFCKINK